MRLREKGLGRAALSVVLAFMLVMSPLLTGCYGSFPLTKAVYKANGEITNLRLIHTLVFWLFLALPVYNITLLGDMLVFNVVQFWTGAKVSSAQMKAEDGTELALAPSPDGREAVLTASRDGAVQGQVRFVRRSDGAVEVRDAAGRLAGRVVRTADGGLRLTNAQGQTLSTISPTQLAEVRAR